MLVGIKKLNTYKIHINTAPTLAKLSQHFSDDFWDLETIINANYSTDIVRLIYVGLLSILTVSLVQDKIIVWLT